MTKDKLLENKKNLIIAGSIALILIIAIIFTIKIVNSSKNNQLSNFEKITIYGYLENFMKPSKLHYLAGDTNIDELQYTQIYIKKSIDNYSKQNGVDVIPTSAIINDLSQNELINTSTLDFHGIAIPNYRYSPDQEAYIKQEGINSSLSFIDSNIIGISDYNEKTTITNIEKLKDGKYLISFNLVDSITSNITSSGTATLQATDDLKLTIESCNISRDTNK